jgi:molecular chaperone DnaK (HSP70)
VLAEIESGSNVLRKAGDHLDVLLSNFVLKKLGYDNPTDPAARGAVSDLRRRQREYKELLFQNGEVAIEVDDMPIVLDRTEFIESERVREFAALLREKFSATLTVACDCAQLFPNPRVPIEILFTGGGHSLPMVTALEGVARERWPTSVATPDFAERSNDPDFQAVRRQVAVAVGGAIRDLPMITAPLHL